MPISERINNWVEDRTKVWGGRLGDFLLSATAKGIIKSLETDEPAAIENAKEIIARLRANPKTPPELKAVLARVEAGGSWWQLLIAIPMCIAMVIQIVQTLWTPTTKQMSYAEEKAAKTFRFDPESVITAWRRDPAKYATLFDDLKDQGMSDDRIDALKFFTEFLPSPRDLVEWEAKEVFEPAMIEKYGLADEFETLDLSLFAKVGVTPEQARNFWIAHWEHASWLQVVEMIRRGKLEEKDLWDWFRLVEIPPYWRQKLIDISWEVPTRVDVRRFWDMRTIDEARLREVYTAIGYHGTDLEDYVLWTKIYVDFPDLLARYKNGWIGLEDIKTELIAMGMKPERAATLIEEKIKKAAPERSADELKLTLSDIYKGVKQNRISREEGVELIQYLGSTKYEAEFKLLVNVPPDEEDKAKAERLLSKAEILDGLETGVITREEATPKLLALRYSAANAELLLKMFDAQVRELEKSDIVLAFGKAAITKEDAMSRLQALDYSAVDAEILLTQKVEPPKEVKLKEVSRADIVLGVKKGIITQEEGYLMLLGIGFSPEASLFILTVQTEESPFSPVNFAEFKDLTQKYRKASGLEGKPMNEEIRAAAQAVILITGERDSLQKSIDQEQRKLVGQEILPAEITAHLNELKVSLRKAEAALSAAKTEYNRLVAEGKFV